MTSVVPFGLEDRLSAATGGRYRCAAPWQSNVVESGRVITGQSPASSRATADAVVRMVELLGAQPC